MADHEKIRRITFSLSELFPEKKNQLEKNKWYYDHSYINYDEWDRNIEDILDNIYDVLAVSFDTWLISTDMKRIIEFYHEGSITTAKII